MNVKIVFISNALDHIQMPLCDAFYEQTRGQFFYVATAQASAIRQKITDEDINDSRNYVLCTYRSESEKKRALEEILSADAAILGSAPEMYIAQRIKQDKLTFRYAERLYKTPFSPKNFARRLVSAMLHHGKYRKKEVYMLCAGAYAAYDHSLMRNYINKCFTWGYFPAFIKEDIDRLLADKAENNKLEILWVGRFISLKHPEHVIELGKYLKRKNISFHISMAGYGELLEEYQELVVSQDLEKEVAVLGAQPPEKIRQLMKRANVLLFTSDRQEGWGAVVNEGMNSGCAVIASSAAGVSPYLVENGENGYLYDNDNVLSLCVKTEYLLSHQDIREAMGRAGYETIKRYWNPDNAAKSLLYLSGCILQGRDPDIKKGPGAAAPIIKDGWFKETRYEE